jgi:hypothetical protein
LFGKPSPTPAEFKADLDAGNRGERLRLYGLMPRLVRKPGEQYSAETDQVLQFMSERSGETDLDKLGKELNRFDRANTNDSARKIGKAILLYDPATRENLGFLTYQAEQKAKQKPEPIAIETQIESDSRDDDEQGESPVSVEDMQEKIAGIIAMPEHGWMDRVAKNFGLKKGSKQLAEILETSCQLGLWKSGKATNKITGEEVTVFAGKEWWDKREAKKLEQERQEAERPKAEEKQRAEEQEQESQQEQEKADRLKAEAEKLKDLPAGSDTLAVVDFISAYCNLSEFGWAEMNIYARENGCTIFDENTGIYSGANHQVDTSSRADEN